MSPYLRKQLVITFIYLTIFAAIGGGIYRFFIYSPANCFDKKLNQGEEQVDCGGPCAECQEELSNPKVIWVKTFPVEGDLYDLVAQIENKNINYGSGALPFTFKVYNSKNVLLFEKNGRSYIMPREKKYIFETVSLSDSPSKIILEFGNIKWQKFKFIENLNLPIFNQRIDLAGKNNYAAYAQGTIYNQTKFDIAAIDINVVVYDLKGNAMAVNKTQKNTMKSGEGRFFEVVWPKSFASDISKVKLDMEAYTNIFSDTNFITLFLE